MTTTEPAQALGRVTAYLASHPSDASAWAVAAEALLHLARPEEAVRAARRARPSDDPERIALLAWALAAAGVTSEARGWLARLGPDHGGARTWERAARAYDWLGDAAAALTAHERAVAVAPEDVGCALRYAERLERSADPATAQAVVDAVLRARPGWAEARRVAVRLAVRMGDVDVAAGDARALLDAGDLPSAVAPGLMLELARIEARRGNVDDAVRWARLGNDAALTAWRARGGDADHLWRELEALASTTLPPATALPEPLPDPPGHRAAFVVGFPRSGTTLTQRMLHAHPQVTTFDELPLVDRALQAVLPGARWVQAAQGCADPAIAAKVRRAWWQRALAQVGGRPGGLVVDKLPLNALRLDVITRVFPDAPVVFVMRDPRDAILSAWLQDFDLNIAMAQLTDPARAARLYHHVWTTWTRARPAHGVTLRYESLVTDPEATWRPVIEALSLDWDEAVVAPRSGPDAARLRTPSYAAIQQPLNARAVGRWRPFAAYLAEPLASLAPHLEALGYLA